MVSNLVVENETISTYDPVKAPSAELVKAKPVLKQHDKVHSRVHEHRWTVEVPRLEKGAKEEGWLKEPTYDEDGNLDFQGSCINSPSLCSKTTPGSSPLSHWTMPRQRQNTSQKPKPKSWC